MLEGVDDDWVDTDHGAVSYANLPGGEYVLRVRAADHRGTWTARDLSVSVDLAVAPWRSWWAFAFYGLIAVAIVLALRLRQQRKLQNMHRTLRLEAAEKALDLTRAVQEGFLPAEDSFDGYRARVHGYCRPAARAAGDWWWYERLDDNDSLLILAGDVTGHGPGPAMVTSAAATAFKVCHKYDPDLRTSLADLNDMVLSVGRGRYLMTMSGVVLDGLTGRFVLHSAGGVPPIRISQGGAVHVLPCRGTPLGSHGFTSGAKTHQLNPGDRLVTFTDGILELPLKRGRVLSMRSFAEMCKDTMSLDLGDAIRALVEKADDLRRDTPQADDWTLVMVEWLG